MIVTRDGRYVLTAAAVDRFVAIWDTEAEKSSTGAAVVLPMDEPAVALDCSGFGRKDRPVEVLALTESGIVHVWTSNDVEGLSKAEAIKISVDQNRTASGKGSKSGRSLILAAKLVGASKDGLGAVLVARGTVARPQFERVALAGQSGSIVLTSSSDGDLLRGAQQPVRGSISKVLPDGTEVSPKVTLQIAGYWYLKAEFAVGSPDTSSLLCSSSTWPGQYGHWGPGQGSFGTS